MIKKAKINYLRLNSALLTILSILVAFIIFAIFLIILKKDPIKVYTEMFKGAFGGMFEFTETIVKVIPLLLCALAVAIPAKCGLLNIGGEGQLHIGAIGATWIALYFNWLPQWLILPCMFLFSALLGAFWAAIPALLKGFYKVNEILITLLLNYIAIYFLEFLVHGLWRDPSNFGWPFSPKFSNEAILPTIDGTRIHPGIVYGIFGVLFLIVIIKYTKFGFYWKLIGDNPKLARYVGVNTSYYILIAMCIGGGFAGISGFGEVSAIQGRLRIGISPGYGYTGFLISWLASNNIFAIPFVALFVGGIIAAADHLQISANLPYDTVNVLQGIIFLVFLIGDALKNELKSKIIRGRNHDSRS